MHFEADLECQILEAQQVEFLMFSKTRKQCSDSESVGEIKTSYLNTVAGGALVIEFETVCADNGETFG